jgi:hypothetical protein
MKKAYESTSILWRAWPSTTHYIHAKSLAEGVGGELRDGGNA